MIDDKDYNFDKLNRENQSLKDKIRRLTQIFIRSLVMIKYLIRAGAVAGMYFWLGIQPAIALGGFIILVAAIQLGIDKVQRSVHPEWDLSEWDL